MMTTMKKESKTLYYVEHRFRCLTDGQIGQIQALALDEGINRKWLAEKFGVSVSTIYNVVRAVPEHLIDIRAEPKRPRKAA